MRVGIVGTGYVGLVTGACLAEHGHQVVCVDRDGEKIGALRAGMLPFYEPGLGELVERNVGLGRLRFSTEVGEGVSFAQVVFIAVGTPPGPNGEADITAVREAAAEIGRTIPGYRVVAVKSTVPVGTADLVAGILASETPFPFDVVSNPEFLRQGAAVKDCLHPERIVVGTLSPRAAGIMRELYRTFDCPLLVTDPRTAEMIKYAANAFLAVKLSFINEMAGLCERLGADVQDVARGIGLDPRIGQGYLKAGIGYGGSCLPKDTRALLHLARRVGYRMPVVEGAVEVNRRQREEVLKRLRMLLGGLEDKVVGILGLAFKPHTDDVRESPALDIAWRLAASGAWVRAYDPKAREKAWEALAARSSGGLSETSNAEEEGIRGRITLCRAAEEVAEGAEALLLLTDWPEFAVLDWEGIRKRMRRPLLFDGRNLLDPGAMQELGFVYLGVGRGTFGFSPAHELGMDVEARRGSGRGITRG